MNIIESFFDELIFDQECYDEIYDFIISESIRCGEYEGNCFILKKLDLNNFIIFNEYRISENQIEISDPYSVKKSTLLKKINLYAKKQGFTLRNSY